ncbi:uncharacterized protein TRIADDRAFT_58269 [Trichoplax adhaerens]|uniref:non-specific serine/threonine protein kinase n=1 Tax=Trichoplax adhaerens TaxID=10228 RepID=B3S1B9_TRIAD|nr:hypothetical protein TRIADDRAFT_58269 [Trichoplax adhaerens]EDV23216.1 hypothetical protein TRIADDRAFT_58269 [Trichoplax adhaerens]|eukprot:XP_002114126.1 hypothetical protein TRIADDRAFT_58269 [Trichoplax adhaerens]
MPQIHNYVMVDSNNGKGIEGVRQEIIQCINAIFQRKDCDLNINGVAKHLYWSRFRDEYSKFKYQAKKNHNNNKHIYFLNDLISDLREDVHKRMDKFLFACEMLHNSGELFMTKYNDQWYFIPDLTWLYERLTEIGQGIVPNVAIPEGDQIIINLAKNAGISAVMSNVINLTRSLTDLTCLPNSPAKPLTLLWEDYHPNEYFYEQTYEIISYSPASLSVLKQIQSNLIRLTQNVHHLWNDGLLFSLGYVECLLLLIESESTPTDDGLVSLKISARCNAIPDADAAEEIQSGLRQTFIMCCYIIEAAFEPLPGIATKTTLKSNVAKENDIEGQLNRPKFDEVDIPAICGHELEKSASEIVCVQCQPYSSENNQQNINKYQKEKISSCTNCGRCNYCIQFMSDVRKESATPAFVNDWSRAFNFQQIGNILKHPSDKEIIDERQVVVSDLNYSIAVNKYPLNFVTGRIFQFTILDIANVDFILGLVTSSYDKTSRPGLTDSSYSIVFTESAFYANNQNMGSLAFDIDHLCPGDQLSIIGRYSADKKKEIVFSRNGLVLLVVNEPDNKDYYPIIHCVDTTADDSRIILQFEGNTIPITQGAKFVTWEKGMRLEAKDRLNPSLMCVATVDDVNDNELLIHFDGWTRKYDYTCKSTSTDIHPIGWCENNYHRQLEPPKGDNKPDFKWAQYLESIQAVAAPVELFTPEQLGEKDPAKISFYASTLQSCTKLQGDFGGCFDAKEIDIHGFEETGHPIAGADCYSQWSQQSIVIIWLISHIILDLIKLQNVYKISSKALRLFGLQEDKIEDDKFVKQAEVILNMITTMLDVPALKICQRLDRNSIMKAIPEIEKLTAEAIEKCATCNAVEIKDRYASNKIHYICPAHTLAIAGNDQNLEEFPSDTILSLNKLCNMKMYNNKIAEIPEQVFQQFSTTLTNINFSGNKLKELPLGMKCLKNIQQIFIGYNEITNIPEGLLSAFSDSLISLDLSSNFIRRLPDDIGTLTNLKMLNLAYNPIDQLSNNIGQLKSLEALNLTGHTLTYLPDTFSSLQNLSKLSLNGVPWIQVTSQDYLHNKIITKETIVDLLMHPSEHVKVNAYTKEQIESLFDECDTNANGILDTQEMINLNAKLYLSFPRLQGRKENEENEGSFLKNLQNFTKLKELHLTHLALSTISEEAISNLTSLINLNLSDNPKLTSLPGVISMLPLKELSLRGTHSLKTPPPEIKNRGFQAIMGYLKRLLTGSVECKRTKLMMVGLGGAGKTSLTVIDHRFNDEIFYATLSLVEALLSPYGQIYESEAEREITDGIDIDTWTVKTDEGRIEYSIWDFAGQTLYYNTHQFFLSDRAVYFLVWNTRLGHEHAGLDFWLSSIACHAPKAPVFVIGTHCDMVSVTELPEEVMKNRYQQIVGFHYVSSFVGTGIPKLKDCLIKETLQQKYMGEKIPQVWLNLEKAILEKGNTVKVLTWNEVTEIASSIGIFDNTELRQAIGFLHDLGSVQHFNNIALRDRVVIDPQWIVDAMACVVSVHETPIKEGKFKHSDMAKIWKQYDKQHHQWLLKLTEQFDLSYALPKQDVNLVPCLLPGTEPKVRLCKFTDNQVIWKTGSLLVKNENKAVMKQLRNTDNLLIEVRGISPNNLLFLIHEILESLIAEAFHGISYEYEVPCIDCLNQGSRDPSMFRSTRIRRASELKAAFLQCEHNFHSVSIHELQSVIPPESPNEFDLHLRNSMRTLTNLSASYELDAYISTLDSDTGVPARIYNDLCSKGYSCYRKQSESGSQDADFLAIKQSNVRVNDSF